VLCCVGFECCDIVCEVVNSVSGLCVVLLVLIVGRM